jgi:PrcB C-terminal
MAGSTLVGPIIQATIVFAMLAQGTNSQITEARQVVVRTADEWQTLWKAHGATAAPPVDFSKSMVVGVFLGERNSAGYGVQITSVRQTPDAIVVEYRERRPAPGSMTAQVITSPFQLVSIPRDARKIEFTQLK